MQGQRRYIGIGEVLTTLYAAPLAIAGLAWLVTQTDWGIIAANWHYFLFFAILMFLFRTFGFFFIAEIRAGRYASSDGSMESMVLWTAVFLFGPTALWLAVAWSVVDFAARWQAASPIVDRWSRARNFFLYQAGTVLASLAALSIYRSIGGEIPLPDLFLPSIVNGMWALASHAVLVFLIWSVYASFAVWIQIKVTGKSTVRPVLAFLMVALGLPFLSHPFAILAAGLFVQNGFSTFLFFITGLVLVALLTRQLSWAAESRRQQSRQLEKLEQLSRDILNAPPDNSTLPLLLREHVPSMFPSGRVVIWTEANGFLLSHPIDLEIDIDPIWSWLKDSKGVNCFVSRDPLPWRKDHSPHNAVVVAPVLSVKTDESIGCIYLELFNLSQPWDRRSLNNLYPAIQSLAAQVASAIHQVELYNQALDYQRVTQELSLAGRIQASFLPDELPRMPGWQLAVTLLPARETSGDFFDLIPLADGKVGILIADVADKGVGAALYMALTRTLIRTYAIEFDDPGEAQPEVVFFAANGRILEDARADLFITAFYGVLDPEQGTLTYANAGHNPPLLLKAEGDMAIESLPSTGMPVGIEEDQLWRREVVKICPGDVLVLYTDGVVDSQNCDGAFFEDRMLLEVIESVRGQNAQEVQDRILAAIQDFTTGAQQFDDITLMVIGRERE